MIAKRIDIEPQNDNFERLALYLAAAGDAGEKLDALWIENCNAGDGIEDIDLAIREVKATQALNKTAREGKTYHLVISFRDERPSEEALRDIDKIFADSLGYTEHQRVIATHLNTDNFHMHIAYNKVHPTTLKVHTPYRDFRTLEQVSRAMELKHGLKVDLGRSDKDKADRSATKARDKEAHTWEQSFDSFVRQHRDVLLKSKDKALGWQDLHKAFSRFDLELRLRGNGLVIANRRGKEAMKASALDRSFTKGELEKSFGPFEKPERTLIRPQRSYRLRPVTRHPGQGRLWRQYLVGRSIKKKESLAVKAFRTWKDFLTYGVIDDPLAMAIIIAQKKLIEAVMPDLKPVRKVSRHRPEVSQDRSI